MPASKPWHTDWTVLYMNPKQQDLFLAVREAQKGFAKVEVGDPIVIPQSQFDSKIAEIVLQLLDSFQRNPYRPELARGPSQEASREFVRNHLSVSIERVRSGDLIIRPMHHEGSGFVAFTNERIEVAGDNLSAKLPAAIRQAFALAT